MVSIERASRRRKTRGFLVLLFRHIHFLIQVPEGAPSFQNIQRAKKHFPPLLSLLSPLPPPFFCFLSCLSPHPSLTFILPLPLSSFIPSTFNYFHHLELPPRSRRNQ